MKRTVWLVGVVVCAGIGVLVWQRQRAPTSDAPPVAASSVAATPVHPVALPPAPDPQTAQHEQQEIADTNAIATDLQLADHDRAALLAALTELQSGRRALFADLAAKKIDAEQVSAGLHELRTKLRTDLERDLGADRAKQILDRIREEHR